MAPLPQAGKCHSVGSVVHPNSCLVSSVCSSSEVTPCMQEPGQQLQQWDLRVCFHRQSPFSYASIRSSSESNWTAPSTQTQAVCFHETRPSLLKTLVLFSRSCLLLSKERQSPDSGSPSPSLHLGRAREQDGTATRQGACPIALWCDVTCSLFEHTDFFFSSSLSKNWLLPWKRKEGDERRKSAGCRCRDPMGSRAGFGAEPVQWGTVGAFAAILRWSWSLSV